MAKDTSGFPVGQHNRGGRGTSQSNSGERPIDRKIRGRSEVTVNDVKAGRVKKPQK